MASQRLLRFLAYVASGLSDAAAARLAGYSEHVAMNTKLDLWNQPHAQELYHAAQRRQGHTVILDGPVPAKRSKKKSKQPTAAVPADANSRGE